MVMLTDPHKSRRDDAAELAKFRRELLGGRHRWKYSIVAGVSIGAVVWAAMDPRVKFWSPIHGTVPRWLIGIGTAAWVVLAILNWRNWRHASRS